MWLIGSKKVNSLVKFIALTKQKGISQVNIAMEVKVESNYGITHRYTFYAVAKAGNVEYRLPGASHIRGRFIDVSSTRGEAMRTSLRTTLETAKTLEEAGFQVTINNGPSSAAEEAVRQYELQTNVG